MNNVIEKTSNINNQTLQCNVEENAYTNQNTKVFADFKTKLQNVIENLCVNKEKTIDEQLNDKFLDLDFADEFKIDIDKIGVNDAIFFVNLLNEQNTISYSNENEKISLTTNENKTIQISNSLLNVLQSSISTNKPIRLDFENNVTVILKMDKEGKIQTHFIPGTAEVEAYLKQNLSSLKQAFDEQDINYSSLSYSKYKENNSKKEKRGNKQ